MIRATMLFFGAITCGAGLVAPRMQFLRIGCMPVQADSRLRQKQIE